jgi:hypothetical protein
MIIEIFINIELEIKVYIFLFVMRVDEECVRTDLEGTGNEISSSSSSKNKKIEAL